MDKFIGYIPELKSTSREQNINIKIVTFKILDEARYESTFC